MAKQKKVSKKKKNPASAKSERVFLRLPLEGKIKRSEIRKAVEAVIAERVAREALSKTEG
jgi:hypothetical protein